MLRSFEINLGTYDCKHLTIGPFCRPKKIQSGKKKLNQIGSLEQKLWPEFCPGPCVKGNHHAVSETDECFDQGLGTCAIALP